MPAASKNYALTWAGIFDAELKNLVHSSAFLSCKWYFVFPKSHWLVLKVFAKFNDESLDGWVHLLLEFEQDVPAETFAKLRKLFDETTVVSCQKYKYLDWNLFRFLSKGFYLFLESLFETQLLIISNQSLLDVAFLLCKHLLLILQHLFIDT